MSTKHKKSNKSRSRSRSRSRSKGMPHREKQRNKDKANKKRDLSYSSSSSSSSSSGSKSQSGSAGKEDRPSSNQKQKHPSKQQAGLEPRFKVEQTKSLKIEKCTNRQAAERALTDASITAGTSVPDEVQLKEGSIYAKYPSIQVSTKIKDLLKQTITIAGQAYRINFYPYKRIDLNMAYDWYCEKCDYKNFARRNKCYRCDGEKNASCKLNFNTVATSTKPVNRDENINNCSLMVRGHIITEIQEENLLDVFELICSVKDIRMIRNKMTGQLKDFAFIEFFTPEDAALALKRTSHPDFKIRGEKVTVMYSRNKSDDDYAKPLPYEKKQRKKDFNKKEKKNDEPVESYYSRQRQLQIQQQKQRPLITIEQLKQKRQQQLRKKAANARELTQQQSKRRQSELMARQWEKQAKYQNTVLYICVLCRRKFKGQPQMKAHEQNSQLHKYNKEKFELSL